MLVGSWFYVARLLDAGYARRWVEISTERACSKLQLALGNAHVTIPESILTFGEVPAPML